MTGESTDTSFHWQMWKWRAEALQSMATAGTGLPLPPARATPAVQPSWALGTGTNWHKLAQQGEPKNNVERAEKYSADPLLPHHTTWTAHMPRNLRFLSLHSMAARVCWVQYHQPISTSKGSRGRASTTVSTGRLGNGDHTRQHPNSSSSFILGAEICRPPKGA